MPRVIVDENVSLQVVPRLTTLGYDVVVIAMQPGGRGVNDEVVFARATEDRSFLLTRDTHFTNPVRFPPAQTGRIVYLTHGNLQGREEAELVEWFFRTHPLADWAGRLVFLSPPSFIRIR